MSMNVLTCSECGEVIPESAKRCPVCGAETPGDGKQQPAAIPPCEQHFQQLMSHAKQCQQVGDLPSALDYALAALELRCDESAVHALLGHLYEQSGNTEAALEHFQFALQVSPAAAETVQKPEMEVETATIHQARNAWLMAVLIGCVLFSGLAALFTIFPGERNIGRSTIIPLSSRQEPPWISKVPTPIRISLPPAVATNKPEPEAKTVLALDQHVETPNPAPPVPQEKMPPPITLPAVVLGPSASAGIPAEVTTPTMEEADQANFQGKYERAVSIYEELLCKQEKPDPRMLQNLAFCYQQLGNSEKAAEHLGQAVQGYQNQLQRGSAKSQRSTGVPQLRGGLTLIANSTG